MLLNGRKNVTVSILDDGVEYTHPDLRKEILPTKQEIAKITNNKFMNKRKNSIKEIITMPKHLQISMIMIMIQYQDTTSTTKISMELAVQE